jgi:hypothetical protein
MNNKTDSFIMKIILISAMFFSIFISKINAENIVNTKNTTTDIEYNKNISLDKTLKIDLNKLKTSLRKKHNSRILFEWNIP